MNKRVLIAVLAVILAVLGIASLVAWTNGARDRAFSGTETVSVYQVTKNIPAGAEAESLEGSVEQISLPKAGIPATAVTSLASLRGKVATANLVPGEVLVTGRFGTGNDVQETPVPKGLQELSLELSSARVLGGVLKRGDYVGIVSSYGNYPDDETNFVINRVLLLSVTSQAADGDASQSQVVQGGTIQVRLALNSVGVEKVVNAAEFGKIWLTRQGKDADVARAKITHENVLK